MKALRQTYPIINVYYNHGKDFGKLLNKKLEVIVLAYFE